MGKVRFHGSHGQKNKLNPQFYRGLYGNRHYTNMERPFTKHYFRVDIL